ncbi:MAG: PIN domain-containing protein, partial [Chloroflexi bacterium]|nr:PIN domain-containing protein [Chloroflexota bacterium]
EAQPLVTTNHVMGETWTFLRRRLGHRAARDFVLAAATSSQLVTHDVDKAAEREAWAWLMRHDERAYSFVDATSFATMHRLRLVEALAFDEDFSAAGFIEVRP